MQAAYGNYFHANNEVNWTVAWNSSLNRRQEVIDRTCSISISGELHGATQADVTAQVRLLESAYASHYLDFVVYDDNGAVAFSMLNQGSSTGVRVIQPPSYPNSGGGEYSTYRTFQISLSATYPEEANAKLLTDFNESATIVGTGGPRVAWVETQEGDPERQIVRNRTIVRATQSGSQVGKFRRLPPPPPIWPQFEDEPERSTGQSSGQPAGPDSNENFGTSWNYTFTSGGPLVGYPHEWE